jgi:Phage integrase, N-terminal SAM-like domain
LSSLARESHVSASAQNQALNALLFLYQAVLGQPIGYLAGVVRAKRPWWLPVVLTQEEVGAILGKLVVLPAALALRGKRTARGVAGIAGRGARRKRRPICNEAERA